MPTYINTYTYIHTPTHAHTHTHTHTHTHILTHNPTTRTHRIALYPLVRVPRGVIQGISLILLRGMFSMHYNVNAVHLYKGYAV